jgi:uncharacterized SAM-binding protein YcdF (DUF218 family)
MRFPSLLPIRANAKKWLVLALVVAIAWLLAWLAAKSLIVESPLPHADAIVIMSGSAVVNERAELAAQLYQSGRAPAIILTNDNQRSSWSRAEQRNPFYYERAVALLTAAGVPRESITVLPQPVSGTYEEVTLVRGYALQQKLNSILVVTSAYHSRRSLWTLRQVFANSNVSVGLVAVPPGIQSPSPCTWWLHIRGWRMVAGEYAKMIYYRIR